MLYRRHTQVREVEASERFPEGTAPAEGATYADTTPDLEPQQVSHDNSTVAANQGGEAVLVGEHGPELPFGDSDDQDDDETGAEGINPDDHTADELREMAANLDLPTSGTKAELADRINTKLAE